VFSEGTVEGLPLPLHLLHCSSSVSRSELSQLGIGVLENFILDEREEDAVVHELETILGRKRYEEGHWDNAIRHYREAQIRNLSNVPHVRRLLARAVPLLRSAALLKSANPDNRCVREGSEKEESVEEQDRDKVNQKRIQFPHVVDYQEARGALLPHIDNENAAGEAIMGVTCLSPAVLVLRNKEVPQNYVRILLPRRSLYCLHGPSRWTYTHEINASEGGRSLREDGVDVPGADGRRLSIVLRDFPRK
tara:strand:+ start:170 stop:916 length:747 start_codon:yes stop_codon:yes gene_type:complete